MIASTRAACLTPPAVGGIAVIQVVGEAAFTVLARHLRKGGRPVDFSQLDPSELRLCRIGEGEEVLDDAVVCARRLSCGTPVVDLSLHGGPRVVQRVLLMLQREGAAIVEAAEVSRETIPARTALHADAAEALLRAKTRRAAIWLARLGDLLAARIERVIECIRQGGIDEARDELGRLLATAGQARMIIDGPQVVLLGAPNSGKSTLANALAEQEQAIVSHLPGTTRDWTEHAAAIRGVPFTIVDTAGVRDTHDPIEREAIARTLQQVQRADLLLLIVDGSLAPMTSASGVEPPAMIEPPPAVLRMIVYTKADLASRPHGQAGSYLPMPPGPSLGCDVTGVSAKTGQGMAELRTRMIEALGLPVSDDWPAALFTTRQIEACRQARQALHGAADDRTLAIKTLRNLLGEVDSAGG